ncbi:MAG TPA: RIP metalloprotease RseP [Chitinophagaceae bacterium]|nr:RIP metalloprotease RseP [Chitinophagaceae bacterium]
MILLAIDWGSVGIKTLQFILSFSIIVTLHELGHFLTARWFKCRVEKFYLFFNPWFSLWKKKIGETEYGLGWIPFGGYVKIAGMVDESLDKEQLKQPPKPYEFRSKPAWQRLIIMVAGVVVNLLLGFFIYAMMLWYWGDSYIPTNSLKYGIAADSLAQSIGLRDGDKILSLDGRYIEKLKKIPLDVILKDVKTIEVKRNDQKVVIPVPDDFAGKLIKYKAINFVDIRFPFEGLDSISRGTAAAKVGLQKRDRIISINGNNLPFYSDFKKEIRKNRGKQIDMIVVRGTDTLEKKATLSSDGILGVLPVEPKDSGYTIKTINYSFFEAFPAGLKKSIETLESYWLNLKLIFSGKVNTNESLGSVISIGNMFGSSWDWPNFWQLTAFFSLVLALMNILPIPALDGGHALFTIVEIITRRKPSDKFMEYAQMAGMVLLLGLMAYALGLDFMRIFK